MKISKRASSVKIPGKTKDKYVVKPIKNKKNAKKS